MIYLSNASHHNLEGYDTADFPEKMCRFVNEALNSRLLVGTQLSVLYYE